MIQPSGMASCALLLALLLPAAQKVQDNPAATEPKKVELTYPTFEPFVSSRMFELMVGDPKTIDFEKQREELATLLKIQKDAKEAAERVVGGKPQGQIALLQPELKPELRAALPLLPAAMIKLAPLWEATRWSEKQVKDANDVAAFVALLSEGFTPEFKAFDKIYFEGKDAENREELKKLVRWFRSEVAKPEKYAAMIATMDDGPYSGLPYESKTPLKAVQTQKLGEEIELRLCKVERPNEPFVLQAVRKDKVLWSRVVSGGPDESVVEVELRSKPVDFGEYGWKVFMNVQWSQGDEAAYLYLSREGEMLFYFMSW